MRKLIPVLLSILSFGHLNGWASHKDIGTSQQPPHQAQSITSNNDVILTQRLDEVLKSPLLEHSQLGLYIYDLTTQRPLYQHGHRQLLRPASTLKLITAIIALETLGNDYLFTTHLYTSVEPCDSILRGDLCFRGGFDPLFGRDDLYTMLSQLAQRNIRHIEGDIVLDHSFKESSNMGWGWCWDDQEPPLTALPYRRKQDFVTALTQQLHALGISWNGNIRFASIPQEAILLDTRSHTMEQVLIPMMKRSDNFYAESIFYHLAATTHKPYAGRKEAESVYARFFRQIGIAPTNYQIADGSGLSLYNYLTPETLVTALRYAHQHPNLYDYLLPSLPIMGRDGTLRTRCRHTSAQGNVRAKTGTVTGVSSLAGYAFAANGHQVCFAIIHQGMLRAETSRQLQDRICLALTEPLQLNGIRPDTLALPAPSDTINPSPQAPFIEIQLPEAKLI